MLSRKLINNFFSKIFHNTFPGGNNQVSNDSKRLFDLLGGQVPLNTCKRILLKGRFIASVNRGRLFDHVVMNYSDLKFQDIVKITSFILFSDFNEQLLGLVSIGFNVCRDGYDEDEIPVGFGDYGFCQTNPIPVKGIFNNDTYLSSLTDSSGNPVSWERECSTPCDLEGVVGPSDKYKIFLKNGQYFNSIFINPYNNKTSNKAPSGLFVFKN